MKIKLHQNQGTVFLSTSRFKVLAAGRRWGKTVLACIILFTEAIKTKNGIYWLIAPTYGQAKELAWTILVKMIPAELLAKQPNETGLIFKFKNGAEIHLKGADNPETLRGRGLHGLVIDEVATIRNHKSVWEEILRPSLTDYQGFCVFIGTPKGKNYFYEIWLKGQKKEDGYESWSFKSEDNPHILRSEIKAAKEQMNDRYFRQEYEASFEDFIGTIWPEFSEKEHCIEPFNAPEDWESLGCIDPAQTGTTGALNARFDKDGNIYIISEYYQQDVRVSEVCEALKGKSKHWLVDPAAKAFKTAVKQGNLYSIWDEFVDYGFNPMPYENDVDAGINRVAEFLKKNRIKIVGKNCPNLLSELVTYHWAEQRVSVTGENKPVPFKVKDHLCDCLRGIVMSRARASEAEKKAPEGTMAEWESWQEKIKAHQELMTQELESIA